MARSNHEQYNSYPKDAFDNPPQGPVGVHRGARPLGPKISLYALVIVLAVALGVLFWSIFSGQAAKIWTGSQSSSTSVATPTKTSTEKKEENQETKKVEEEKPQESAKPTQSPTPTQTQQPEESQKVNTEAQINVVNGTLVTGYANEKALALQNAGFSDVTPMNPNGMTLPEQSVVWYQNDADLATAQQVANTLGISAVQQAQGLAVPVVVVLMS